MTPQLKTVVDTVRGPWSALWAMMIGFFMILVDSTIVAVANPTMMEQLQTDYDGVIWVTSAYLLAYAVPLLVAGRLGDQFGPKKLYLLGLFIFTVASLWCGLSGSIEMLIAARVVQGLGAALLTPQTLSMITRIFPSERRGVAMGVWGATAGLATLTGPLVGGVLLDQLGWEWIFFVNVPIGVLGLALAVWLIPAQPTNKHRFDLLGVALSGIAMFLVVFGLQEGESHRWAGWIWAMILAGILLFGGFVYWQAVNKDQPLIPLRIFADRHFTLSSLGVAIIGFAVTAMVVPVMFYAQLVCGLTPTRSALLMAPMAVVSGVLAPLVGRLVDRSHPMPIIGFGFSVLAIGMTWLSVEMTPTTAVWRLVLPFIAMGVGMAFIWSPLAATATRNLAPQLAGAGSGVYNATRQVGSVLGSAGVAAFMTSRIGAELPDGAAQRPPIEGAVMELPEFLHAPFAAALSQSMLLPAFVSLFGVVAAIFLADMVRTASAPVVRRPASEERTEVLPVVSEQSDAYWRAPQSEDDGFHDGFDEEFDDGIDEDDDYVEFTVDRPALRFAAPPEFDAGFDENDHPADDSDTAPLPAQVADTRSAPPEPEPIGFAHNGFHTDDDMLQPLPRPAGSEPRRGTLHHHVDTFQQLAERIDNLSEDFADLFEDSGGTWSAFEVPEDRPPRHRPRHYREDPDDGESYGRHSRP